MTEEDPKPAGYGEERVTPETEHTKVGTAATHPWGVQYQGPFESATDGSARAVRLHARALANTGMPVLLQSFTNSFVGPDGIRLGAEAMDETIKRETHDLRHASIANLAVRVKHLVVSGVEQLRSFIIPKYVAIEQDVERAIQYRDAIYRTTIVYSVWERTTLDESIAAILRRVGECWVPCHENKLLLERHGIERVTVVPHPWDPASDLAKLVKRLPMKRKHFYSIGLWQPRKHYHETIGAFLLAFRPGDLADLTIKHRVTKLPGYPTPQESVSQWLADARVIGRGWTAANLESHLWLPSENWSDDRILKLHYDSNIYVAASRGEAYCLPAFDAKVAGNKMIATGYGGQRDFASPDEILLPYLMKDVPPEYGWEPGAKWAEVSIEALAQAMQDIPVPASHARDFKGAENSTMQAVGELMKARVLAVAERAKGMGA